MFNGSSKCISGRPYERNNSFLRSSREIPFWGGRMEDSVGKTAVDSDSRKVESRVERSILPLLGFLRSRV